MSGLFSGQVTGNVSQQNTYVKSTPDLTVSQSPTKVFRDVVIMGGGTTATKSFTPAMTPWIYNSQAEAAMSCAYWIQKLDTHFKGMDNGNVNFRLANFTQQMSTKLPSQAACSDGTFGYGVAEPLVVTPSATYAGGTWMELIVGTDPAKTVIYSMSYQYQMTANPTYDSTCLYSFRSIFQTTMNAPSTGFQGTACALNSPALVPAVTVRTGSFVLPAASPIWFMPISIECQF